MTSPRARPRRRLVVVLIVVAAVCLAAVLVVGFFPVPVDGGVDMSVRRVLTWLQARGAPAWVNYDFADFIANIGFFVPVGFLGALLLPRRFWWVAILIGAVLSTGLEVGQALFLPARFASVTDVIANTTGSALGAMIGFATRLAVARRRAPRSAPR